jgi:ATP-binding cassette subfamily F protein 3
MIQVRQLEKSFGGDPLFSDVTFTIHPGEKIGLVGRNGHGKSTLLKILLGEMTPDQGEVIIPRGYRLGYLEQHIAFTKKTVLEEAATALPADAQEDIFKVEKILFGLGFDDRLIELDPKLLSGGYQVRLNLCKALASESHCYFLDEPTNYLDILSIRWLIKFLKSLPNELIIVTHDRSFMDAVCNCIVGLHRGDVKKIKGKTGDYFNKIAEEEIIHEKTRLNDQKKIQEMETFVNRFRATASKASMVQSRVKMLEKMDVKEKLANIQDLKFQFTECGFTGKRPLVIEKLNFHYVPEKPLIANLSCDFSPGDRIAIIGKNGLGKSTLLELIANQLKPVEGVITLHTNAKMAYYKQTNKKYLNDAKTIEEEILSENPMLTFTEVRRICGTVMFSGDTAKKKIGVLSGGEKSRVLLGKVLVHPTNFLLLDEPTNHLDLQSVMALTDGIISFKGVTIMVTHDESLLKKIFNKFIVFQEGKTFVFEGTYDEFLAKVGWQNEEKASSGNGKTGQLGQSAQGIQEETPNAKDDNNDQNDNNDKNEKKENENEQVALEPIDYSDYKKVRRDLIQERGKKLQPLKEKVERLEKNIFQWEEEIKKLEEELTHLTGNQVKELGIKLKEKNLLLTQSYEEYEVMGEDLQEQEQVFEKALAELEKRLKK